MVVAPRFYFRDPGVLAHGELELVLTHRCPSDTGRGWVPAYGFDMRVGGRIAGAINLRIGDGWNLIMYGGHIGYRVCPESRGHRYAERSCRLLFPLARAHGITALWITCDPHNTASRRTCERLGARLVEIVPLPPELEMLDGGRWKCRYCVDLGDSPPGNHPTAIDTAIPKGLQSHARLSEGIRQEHACDRRLN